MSVALVRGVIDSKLLSPPRMGRCGYARALVKKGDADARRQGYSWIRLVTGQSESLYDRRIWSVLNRVIEPHGPAVLMRTRLGDGAGGQSSA